jgi:hypothetical protein
MRRRCASLAPCRVFRRRTRALVTSARPSSWWEGAFCTGGRPTPGWQRGTVARVCAPSASGFAHVVAYARQRSMSRGTMDTLLVAASLAPAGGPTSGLSPTPFARPAELEMTIAQSFNLWGGVAWLLGLVQGLLHPSRIGLPKLPQCPECFPAQSVNFGLQV